VYSLSGHQLTEKAVLTHLGPITDVAFSPDGTLLAAADGNRKVALYRTSDYQVTTTTQPNAAPDAP
jgi:WD40 repeat protein